MKRSFYCQNFAVSLSFNEIQVSLNLIYEGIRFLSAKVNIAILLFLKFYLHLKKYIYIKELPRIFSTEKHCKEGFVVFIISDGQI